MIRACKVATVVMLVGVAVAGCKKDECAGGPAQAQIDVQLAGVAASDVSSVDVTLVINSGKPITRAFTTATPSFTVEFKDQDRAPRSISIKAVAYNAGKVIGTGETSVTFTGDACNFFTVAVKPGGAVDGGPDSLRPDTGLADGPKPDLPKPDGPKPDVLKPDGSKSDGPKPDVLKKPDGPKSDGPKSDVAVDGAKPDALTPDALKPDASMCGNGVIEGTEECDGSAFPAGKSQCQDFNRNGGNLLCTSCKFDLMFCCLAPVPPAGIPKAPALGYIVSAAVGDDATLAPLCKPFRTITAALKKANVTNAPIYVTAGTYSAGETFPLSVTSPTLTLYGAGSWGAWAIIDGAGPSTLMAGNATMEATGGAVVIGGFQFKGGSAAAVRGIVWTITTGPVIGNIGNNSFLTETGAHIVSSGNCPALMNNTFQTSGVGLHLDCLPAPPFGDVSNNTFSGGKVGIEITAGAPVIANNSFSGVYSTAAITLSGNASPKLRTNIFSIGVAPKRTLTITGSAVPDLGTGANPGGNSFLGGALEHAGSAMINAIGNDWPGTPTCGTRIISSGSGKVVWGELPGQQCP